MGRHGGYGCDFPRAFPSFCFLARAPASITVGASGVVVILAAGSGGGALLRVRCPSPGVSASVFLTLMLPQFRLGMGLLSHFRHATSVVPDLWVTF